MGLSRRERRIRARRWRRGGIAAATLAAGALALGGLGAAGALPDVVGLGDGGAASHVSDHTDTDGADSHTAESEDAPHPASVAGEGDGSGLANASGNVTNPVASAVLEVLQAPGVAELQGSGRGEAVSGAATTAADAQSPSAPTGADHRP